MARLRNRRRAPQTPKSERFTTKQSAGNLVESPTRDTFHAAISSGELSVRNAGSLDQHAALLGDTSSGKLSDTLHRAMVVRQLQRNFGNRYVSRLLDHVSRQNSTGIQAKMAVGPAGDKYEREADHVAKQVLGQMKGAGEQPVQRQGMEEEELQAKPLQREIGMEGGDVSGDLESSINGSRGSGRSIEKNVRSSMEDAFGADFSDVKVHSGAESTALNDSMSARAFTTGNDIFFRQGEYNPGSDAGKEILAHELTHVVQQTSPAPTNSIGTKEMQEPKVQLDNDSMALEESAPLDTEKITPTSSDQTQREVKVEPDAEEELETPEPMIADAAEPEVPSGTEDLVVEESDVVIPENRERSDATVGSSSSPAKGGGVDPKAIAAAVTAGEALQTILGSGVGKINQSFSKVEAEENKDASLSDADKEAAGLTDFKARYPVMGALDDFFSSDIGTNVKLIGKVVAGVASISGVFDAIKAYKDRKAEFSALSSLEAKQKKAATPGSEPSEFAAAIAYSVKKAFRSVFERALSAAASLIKAVTAVVTSIATLAGAGPIAAAVGVTTLAIVGGIQNVRTIAGKAKGLWKWAKGTRGVARGENAGVIVETAKNGGPDATDAAELIKALRPAGLQDLLEGSSDEIIAALRMAEDETVEKLKAGMADKIKST